MNLQLWQMNACPGQSRLRLLGQMPPLPQEGEAKLHLGPRVSTEGFAVAPYWTSPGALKADIPFVTGAAAGSSGGALAKFRRSLWNSGP